MNRPIMAACAECGEDFALNSAMLRTLAVLRRNFPGVEPAGYLCEPCSDQAEDSGEWVNLGRPVEAFEA